MKVVLYILRTAWGEPSKMARVVYVISVAVPAGLSVLAGRIGWAWLDGLLPWWGWLLIAFAVVLCLLLFEVGKRAIRLEESVSPRLKVGFDPKVPGFVTRTHYTRRPNSLDPHIQVIYVHVLPEAVTEQVVRDCRGYLTGIYVLRNGKWQPTAYRSRLELAWSNYEPGPRDVIPEVRQFLDVFKVDSNVKKIEPCTDKTPNSVSGLFTFRGSAVYRFDVTVVGEGTTRASISLQVRETDRWDKPEVRILN